MEDNNKFGQRLKELRIENNETQQKASEKIGIHINTLKNYEKTGRIPNANELIKIKNHYNVSYEYLFGESNIKRNDMNFIEIGKVTGLSENAIKKLSIKSKTNEKRIKGLNFIIENEDEYQLLLVLELYLMARIESNEIYQKMKEFADFNPKDKLKYVNSGIALSDMLKCSIDRILYQMENDLVENNKKK